MTTPTTSFNQCHTSFTWDPHNEYNNSTLDGPLVFSNIPCGEGLKVLDSAKYSSVKNFSIVCSSQREGGKDGFLKDVPQPSLIVAKILLEIFSERTNTNPKK